MWVLSVSFAVLQTCVCGARTCVYGINWVSDRETQLFYIDFLSSLRSYVIEFPNQLLAVRQLFLKWRQERRRRRKCILKAHFRLHHTRHSCFIFTALWCGLICKTRLLHHTPILALASRHNGTNNTRTPPYYRHASSPRIPGL